MACFKLLIAEPDWAVPWMRAWNLRFHWRRLLRLSVTTEGRA